MSVDAPNAATALIWRRVSAVGWSSIYTIILHFLLRLTGHQRVFKKWWFYALIYAPAILNILIFCVLNSTASAQGHMVRAAYGWVCITSFNFWEILFDIYYVGYVLAGIAVICLWKRQNHDKDKSKQANLIIVSFTAALLLGTVTDVVLSAGANPFMPQMGPVVIIFPVSVFFYLVKHYGLMQPDTTSSNQLILNDRTRTKLFYYLSVIFMVFGLLSYIYIYAVSKELTSALHSSAILVLIGVLLFSIQRIKTEALRYAFNTLVILLTIPAMSLLFIQYGSITSWVFPVVLVIISLVFNRRSMLVTITGVTVISQILIWMYAPQGPFQLTVFDYGARIAFFIAVFLLGLYVNRIYVSKLKENSYQIELQKLVSDISFDFARAEKSSLDENINTMLKKTGTFFKADRSFIFLFDYEKGVIALSYEWCREGINPEIGLVDPRPMEAYSRWLSKMSGHMTMYHEDVRKLPTDVISDNKLFISKKIVSLITAPIETNDTMYGVLGFSSAEAPIKISQANLELLQTFANLLADKIKMMKAESEIERMAFYDQLTGLPNRLLFNDRIKQAIHQSNRTEKFVGVIFMDLDSFKAVNDTMGHRGGDELLKEVSKTLSANVRKSDTVARFGGDEFLILLNDISDVEQIQNIARNVMKLFGTPFRLYDQEYFVTASAGIAVYPLDGNDGETLIKNADIAMYRAKAAGTNQLAVCTPEMKSEVYKNMMLSNSLYRALERGEFMVYYQPQVSLATGAIIGFEALLRWNHPKLGMIPPNIFIPLAEKNGLINSIGDWVLKTACQQNKKWQDEGLPHLRMAVNLSVLQFRNPKLVETVEAVLKETGLNPDELELEITESMATQETAYIMDTLKSLKQLGISISIDDFGTEYSSLNRLKDLPIDRIKIDMQFIRGLEGNEKNQAITLIIINLAKNLGLQVIAEGVETQPQFEFLKNKNCDDVQGYYFYKPMPPEQLVGLFEHTAAYK